MKAKEFVNTLKVKEMDMDPDGLNTQMYGQFTGLLKDDIFYLLARGWGCHPSVLTSATKRMGEAWVKQQIAFVQARLGVTNRGRYLSAILARNVI